MTDKLSDHYTTARTYTDIDGMTRNFDIIDHDIHRTTLKGAIVRSRDEKIRAAMEVIPKTDLEQLIEKIVRSGVNEMEEFKKGYDKLGEKYGYERYNRLESVAPIQMNAAHRGDMYYKDMKKLYVRAIHEHIKSLKEKIKSLKSTI